jgi:hypothetical protein
MKTLPKILRDHDVLMITGIDLRVTRGDQVGTKQSNVVLSVVYADSQSWVLL